MSPSEEHANGSNAECEAHGGVARCCARATDIWRSQLARLGGAGLSRFASRAEPLLDPALSSFPTPTEGRRVEATVSAADLARILGNVISDPQPAGGGGQAAVVRPRLALGGLGEDGEDVVPVPAERETPSGEVVDEQLGSDSDAEEHWNAGPPGALDALGGRDSEAAASFVREADSEAINTADGLRRTALLLIAMEGHEEACRLLLAREDFAHPNARNLIGSTALHLAAGNGHRAICKLLLASPRFAPAGGINAQNNNGQTPLDFALEFRDGLAVEILANAGGTASDRSQRRGRRGVGLEHCRHDTHAHEAEENADGGDRRMLNME